MLLLGADDVARRLRAARPAAARAGADGSAGDLLVAMLDQETGAPRLRPDRLARVPRDVPVRPGLFTRALAEARGRIDRSDATMVEELESQAEIARRWQEMAELAVARVAVARARGR